MANICPFFSLSGNVFFYLYLFKVLFKVKDAITLNYTISGSTLMCNQDSVCDLCMVSVARPSIQHPSPWTVFLVGVCMRPYCILFTAKYFYSAMPLVIKNPFPGNSPLHIFDKKWLSTNTLPQILPTNSHPAMLLPLHWFRIGIYYRALLQDPANWALFPSTIVLPGLVISSYHFPCWVGMRRISKAGSDAVCYFVFIAFHIYRGVPGVPFHI